MIEGFAYKFSILPCTQLRFTSITIVITSYSIHYTKLYESGDLTKRKLIPSVYDLYHQKLLPKNFAIVGVGRTQIDNDNFRQSMSEGIHEFSNIRNNFV